MHRKEWSLVDQISEKRITVPLRWAAGGLFVGWMFLFTAVHSLVFLSEFLTLTHTQCFHFQAHTHSQCLLRCIQAWQRIGFVTLLNWDVREQGSKVLRNRESAFPSLGSHYSDRMTYKTACFCTTTEPHLSEEELPVLDQPFLFSCPTAKWNSDFILHR